ncbi:hypothetical protein [Roseicyclus marinus]|uniref:hypothetical protein n=1 Tax=Roseicyclus marinus TaxID=2161673 RepID=UPI00240F3BB3|nr:hypothetical protein [Roseicyclus marinus]MDG3040068.1 hypothetical protein [Roseicyclus marinus]
MKAMALSGVFVLASAGLALASVAASDSGATKPEAATLVSVTQDEVETIIRAKKADFVEEVTATALPCGEGSAALLCAEAVAKE